MHGIPWKLSSTPGQVKANHPLGSDTRWALRELLGIEETEFLELKERGILT